MNYVFLPQDRLPFASPSTLIMWPVFPVYGKSLNERIEKDKYMMVCLIHHLMPCYRIEKASTEQSAPEA